MRYLRWTKRTPAGTIPPIKYGEVLREDDSRLSSRTKEQFIASGTLAPVSTPPLSELPGWEERAAVLAEQGVITVSDLAGAGEKSLAKVTGKSISTIRKWRGEAERWLNPEPEPDDDD